MARLRSKPLGLPMALALLPGLAGAQAVAMKKMPPVAKGVAAFPEIAAPKTDAQRAINGAVSRLDRKVLAAMKSCVVDDKAPGDWERTVNVTMAGPGWLSYEIADSAYCGGAHPNSGTTSIVYDLTTGKPVDWTKLLPFSLTGTIWLAEGMDAVKMVTLSSKTLYGLYLAGYPTSDADCLGAVRDAGPDPPAQMMVWLNAAGGGVAVQFDMAHVMEACAVPVTISTATLRTLCADRALMDAIDAAHAEATAKASSP